jgi:hypothetical protein
MALMEQLFSVPLFSILRRSIIMCVTGFQENAIIFKGSSNELSVKFGSIDNHSPMRGHMGHLEASQGDLENQPDL